MRKVWLMLLLLWAIPSVDVAAAPEATRPAAGAARGRGARHDGAEGTAATAGGTDA